MADMYVSIKDVLGMLEDCECAEGFPGCRGGDDCSDCAFFSINHNVLVEELEKLDKYSVDEILEVKLWGRED